MKLRHQISNAERDRDLKSDLASAAIRECERLRLELAKVQKDLASRHQRERGRVKPRMKKFSTQDCRSRRAQKLNKQIESRFKKMIAPRLRYIHRRQGVKPLNHAFGRLSLHASTDDGTSSGRQTSASSYPGYLPLHVSSVGPVRHSGSARTASSIPISPSETTSPDQSSQSSGTSYTPESSVAPSSSSSPATSASSPRNTRHMPAGYRSPHVEDHSEFGDSGSSASQPLTSNPGPFASPIPSGATPAPHSTVGKGTRKSYNENPVESTRASSTSYHEACGTGSNSEASNISEYRKDENIELNSQSFPCSPPRNATFPARSHDHYHQSGYDDLVQRSAKKVKEKKRPATTLLNIKKVMRSPWKPCRNRTARLHHQKLSREKHTRRVSELLDWIHDQT